MMRPEPCNQCKAWPLFYTGRRFYNPVVSLGNAICYNRIVVWTFEEGLIDLLSK